MRNLNERERAIVSELSSGKQTCDEIIIAAEELRKYYNNTMASDRKIKHIQKDDDGLLLRGNTSDLRNTLLGLCNNKRDLAFHVFNKLEAIKD